MLSSDYIEEKTDHVDRLFETCNFSMILRGRGQYHFRGKTWAVEAPCVITQWPGERATYGPGEGSWSEWYLIYDAGLLPEFEAAGFLDSSRPVWPVADPVSLHRHWEEFRVLSRGGQPERVVDLADRVAERALLDTLLERNFPWDEDPLLQQVLDAIREQPGAAWDFAELARKHGCSQTTFRRRWVAATGRAPGEFLRNLRMAEACRLLVESRLLVKEIARVAGFDDELYFSRRFRKETGFSAREYRRRFTMSATRPSA